MSNDFKKYFPNPSRTKQCFKDECDINNILKKYKNVMGVEYLSQFNTFAGGQFGDFSGIQDYRSALDKVNQAKSFFDSLPATVRRQFSNDAAQFLDFAADPNNRSALEAMGIVPKSAPNQDAPSKPVDPTPAA